MRRDDSNAFQYDKPAKFVHRKTKLSAGDAAQT